MSATSIVSLRYPSVWCRYCAREHFQGRLPS
jgi:hypothetical protein